MSHDPRALLRARGLAPKKSFGQCFLVNAGVLERIADACVPPEERAVASVLEIGAGTGALTRALVERARHVVAVERDRDLVPLLEAELAAPIADGRLRLVEGSATHVDLGALLVELPSPRVLAGNLPYQLTGQLLERAIALGDVVSRAVFMIQDEVAARLVARPGTKEYGALGVFVQARFEVSLVARVSPGSFFPPPDVTSAVVRLVPHARPRAVEDDALRALVKAAFAQRRKTLRNAWSSLGAARIERASRAAGIDLGLRGEVLAVEDFARVAAALRSDEPLAPHE